MARILIIDDDAVFRSAFRRRLERRGHTVDEIDSGALAVASIQANPPDLIVTDILMPDQDGIETIAAIREVKTDIKILAVSGGSMRLTQSTFLRAAKHLGADRVEEKPFDLGDLVDVVDELLGTDS